MTIWKDITQPPSSNYIWYRLNEEGGFVGYFGYKGSKWVLLSKKEVKQMNIDESHQSIIDSIVDGAPELYDTLKEVSDKIVDLSDVAFSGDYADLSNKPNERTFKEFKSSWPTGTTLEAFCSTVINDSDAKVGNAYLGGLSCSGLPTGMGQGDVVVEIIGTNDNKVVKLTLTSTDVSPYHWEGCYWQGSFRGWKSFELQSNKVTSFGSTPSDTKYPSEKLVKDSLDTKQPTIDSSHKLSYSLLSDTPTIPTVPTDMVKYTAQSLTDAQKVQARNNIGAGTGDAEFFEVDKQYTTGAEMKAAYDAGKILRLKALQGPGVYVYEDLAFFKDEEDYYEFWFSSVQDTHIRTDMYDSQNGWTTTFENVSGKENKSNKVTSWSDTPTNSNYPSEKLVYNEVHPAIQTVQPVGGFLPNIMYNVGVLSGNTTFVLANEVNGIVNHYYWIFDIGNTTPTIVWPVGVNWNGGSAPVISTNKHYEISVLNNVGCFIEADTSEAYVSELIATGTQYIDTGIKGSNTLGFEVVFTAASLASSDPNSATIFGVRNDWDTGGFQLSTCNEGWLMIGSEVYDNSSISNINVEYTVSLKNNNFEVNNVVKNAAINTSSFTTTGNIQIFGLYDPGWLHQHYGEYVFELFSGSIKRLTLFSRTDPTDIVADFRPYRVGTTGCMKDLVSGNLFFNSGTGNFGYGNDITI